MADIIELEGRRGSQREILLEAVGRLIRCGGCRMRCARCGYGLGEEAHPVVELGLLLCPVCHAEYKSFARRKEGVKNPEVYWQNEAWQETWEAWLAFQKALLGYRQSKEFARLMAELSTP